MNIHCEWYGESVLQVWSGINLVATVTEHTGEPILIVYSNHDGVSSLTFNEIEHIMDNWNNLPKK